MTPPRREGFLPCVAVFVVLAGGCGDPRVQAQDVSAEPILQVFEGRWETVEDRTADIFLAGYGRLWLPPPQRADSGGLSAGYDVFDRFDLGVPRNETLYGTETGLRTLVGEANRAGIKVNTDFIFNHNGFSDNTTFDNQGTPLDKSDDVTFVESGGYPGFFSVFDDPATPGVDLPFGDFHPPQTIEQSESQGRLAGLNDLNQSLNLQFIRTPVDPADPRNIPAGAAGIFGRPPANVPDPNNARFYPDQGLGSTTVFDPRLNRDVTLFDFNTENPLAGDAVPENGLGLILRNARWLIQDIGVDGFRLDAARHFDRFVLDFFDQATFLAEREPLLDGSRAHPFTFIETGGGSNPFLQSFIRDDIDNSNLGQVGGNRTALDFNLFFGIRANLSENGLANDWRNIKNLSIDVNDDGFANNGSQGVAFAQSHDDGPAFLNNVAHAYLLLRPGEAIVYTNLREFGDNRDFPQDGRGDALGGVFGDTVTTLVDIRNSYGRGNYLDRTPAADEKELLIYERENSALVVLNNRLDSGFDERTVQTGFAPGTRLVELTGNADDDFIDPNDDLASVVVVDANGQVTVRSPRNVSTPAGSATPNQHNSGYLIYGVARPEGRLRLTDASGADLTGVLPGSTPSAEDVDPGGPSLNFLNGTTRLADITVVQDEQIRLRIETDPVTLPDGFRDQFADGDSALFRIDGGIDANGNGRVDFVTPGAVTYGFEVFTETNDVGFFNEDGQGLYEQTIDATRLSEGRHFITGRVFRNRDGEIGGDGGPAVFTDFREVIYVDLLPPEAAPLSFEPFASDPDNPNNRDLIVQSTDGTADNMHFLLDLPAGVSDEEALQMALAGVGDAGEYDRDSFIFGFFGVTSGNHTVTVVAFEPTFDGENGFNVQRFNASEFAGLSVRTDLGLGIGDLDADGTFEVADLSGPSGFEAVLTSGNELFNAAADANADGLVDNRDLFILAGELTAGGAAAPVFDELEGVLERRGDLNGDGRTDGGDLLAVLDAIGEPGDEFDVNVDGSVTPDDAAALITELLRTAPGDYNLDGAVDAADYTVWRDALSGGPGSLVADGDLDGVVDAADYQIWLSAFGFERTSLAEAAAASSAAVPEPASAGLAALLLSLFRITPPRSFALRVVADDHSS